ncbi:MAG: hypothetical protein VB087_04470 [Candidatus Limiplasma sp.]|nr:hypothetical protein [Candidatus Limiplasma sp.]MEA5146545.1 hypothetical protein [Candidatus Limiplasma sp.]
MKDRIWAMLEKIEDEQLLESIYWYIERKLVREAAAEQRCDAEA